MTALEYANISVDVDVTADVLLFMLNVDVDAKNFGLNLQTSFIQIVKLKFGKNVEVKVLLLWQCSNQGSAPSELYLDCHTSFTLFCSLVDMYKNILR